MSLLKDKRCSSVRYCYKGCGEYGEKKSKIPKTIEERLPPGGTQLLALYLCFYVSWPQALFPCTLTESDVGGRGLIKILGRTSLGLY